MSPLPTVNDVQPIDPILTNFLVGYMQADSRFVADRVFPGVGVPNISGTFFKATKKYWFLDQMKPRAGGTPFARGEFGLETDTYATMQYALAYGIDDETRANSQVPMDLEQAGARWLAQQVLMRKERMWAADFMAASVWGSEDNNSATDWDDYTSGDPIANIAAQVRAMSDATGYKPNSLVMGGIVHEALTLHPEIIDRLKYTAAATLANIESALAAIFGLSNWIVGRASYNSANEGQTASYGAIIDDDALLCYVDPGAGIMGATCGKTFYWQPGGGMGSVLPMYRDDRNLVDEMRTRFQIDQKVTATDLGYIWLDIV